MPDYRTGSVGGVIHEVRAAQSRVQGSESRHITGRLSDSGVEYWEGGWHVLLSRCPGHLIKWFLWPLGEVELYATHLSAFIGWGAHLYGGT